MSEVGLYRNGQRLPIQGGGREAVVQKLRARRHRGKQGIQLLAHRRFPLRVEAVPPPPEPHAPQVGLLLLEQDHPLIEALARPALCLRKLEVLACTVSDRCDHQGVKHAGFDEQPLLLSNSHPSSKIRAGRRLLMEAERGAHLQVLKRDRMLLCRYVRAVPAFAGRGL